MKSLERNCLVRSRLSSYVHTLGNVFIGRLDATVCCLAALHSKRRPACRALIIYVKFVNIRRHLCSFCLLLGSAVQLHSKMLAVFIVTLDFFLLSTRY